jgi:peptidoglycan hydrolase-like protein with peptidoglycan-binding domain
LVRTSTFTAMSKHRIFGAFAMAACCMALSACGQWTSAQSVPTTQVVVTTTTEPEIISASGQRSGVSTKAAQKKLLSLGFWLLTPSGKYDETTRQAVMAFQKYYQLRPTGSMNDATAFLLDKLEVRPQAQATNGTLAEVDKARQLLFLVEDGITKHVINASTGDDRPYVEPDMNTPGVLIRGTAITPVGKFKMNRERPDGWWVGDLGQIYRPKYFIGGVAIHGSQTVPAYPASHGCVRVTTAAMDMIWDSGMLPLGADVVVYGELS